MTKRQKFFSALGKFLKNVFTKNILLKVVALVFALLLWGYVLSEVKPKYVKRIYDVEIELRNEDSLKQKGWVVVNEGTYLTDVNVEAEIDKHSMLDSSRVKCYVDLDRIPLNEQDPDRKTVTLDVMTSIPEYGVLKSVSIQQLSLTIERTWVGEYMTATVRTVNSLPDIVKTGDAAPEYFECIPPKTVTVPALSGLKSEIEQIARAEVVIDLATFANMDPGKIPGLYSLILPVTFYNADGEVMDIVSISDVKVTVNNIEIRRYKEVPIELNTVVPDTFLSEIYEWTCQIEENSGKTVRIYGDAEELAKITTVKTEKIMIPTTEGEDTISVKLVVPNKVNTDKKESVSVYLGVSKRLSEEIAYEIPIVYTGIGEGLIPADAPETFRVGISGTADTMPLFNEKWITATVDLSGRSEGTYEVPVVLGFRGIDLHIEDYRVEETGIAGETMIRITYVASDGTVYLFSLPQKTVTVRLASVNTETEN